MQYEKAIPYKPAFLTIVCWAFQVDSFGEEFSSHSKHELSFQNTHLDITCCAVLAVTHHRVWSDTDWLPGHLFCCTCIGSYVNMCCCPGKNGVIETIHPLFNVTIFHFISWETSFLGQFFIGLNIHSKNYRFQQVL